MKQGPIAHSSILWHLSLLIEFLILQRPIHRWEGHLSPWVIRLCIVLTWVILCRPPFGSVLLLFRLKMNLSRSFSFPDFSTYGRTSHILDKVRTLREGQGLKWKWQSRPQEVDTWPETGQKPASSTWIPLNGRPSSIVHLWRILKLSCTAPYHPSFPSSSSATLSLVSAWAWQYLSREYTVLPWSWWV